jgi:carboxypeptidase PM20D1
MKIRHLLLVTIIFFLSVVMVRTLMLHASDPNIQSGLEVTLDEERALANLSEAIKFKTVSEDRDLSTTKPEKEPSFSEFIAYQKYLERTFQRVYQELSVKKYNEHGLLYKWEGTSNQDPIIFIAHYDVVPAYGLDNWQVDPFSGLISDGYVWGRGTLDDKSSMIAILEAVESLLAQNYRPQRTIYLSFGHDEEIGGKNGASAIAADLHKSGVHFDMVLDEGGFILNDVVPGVTNPVALVGVAEKGYLTLELSVTTESGHSSMPPSQTAVGLLSSALLKLEKNPMPARYEGGTKLLFEYLAPHMGFMKKAVFSNDWLFEPIIKLTLEKTPSTNAAIRTTFAPTVFRSGVKDNVLPTLATALVNVRMLPGDTSSKVVSYVQEVIGDSRVAVKKRATLSEAISPSPLADHFKAIQDSVVTVSGKNVLPAPFLTITATDSRHFAKLSDNIYRFLPIQLNKSDLDRIHGYDERISVKEYIKMIRFYVALIRQY